jgi:uncharacterized cofD-like protein
MTEIEAPHIAVIGGGTGSFTLLQELKHFTPNVSALVNMSDDGGSTGRLRDELGVLPPGDVRQCLVALSDAPEIRDLFNFRFGEGGLAGHSLGNVILSGLELQHGDFVKAIKVADSIFRITGKVIPITTDKHTLMMKDGDETIRGEYRIGHREIRSEDAVVYLEPAADLHPEAEEAILTADLVAIAPGNLYGSLLPALSVRGIAETLQETPAPKVAVANLVTKPGQTDGWHVVDYVKTFEKYIGKLDTVLYNDRLPDRDLLDKYAAEDEYPVGIEPGRFTEIEARAIGSDLLADSVFAPDTNDREIRRTLIRHDARKVGRLLMQICAER